MNPQKPTSAATSATSQGAVAASAKSGAPTTTATSGRKAWVKKTPVEIVLEQIGKQEEKVAGMRKELAREERELTKLQQAKKILEAQ
jgi:hypothetical protein